MANIVPFRVLSAQAGAVKQGSAKFVAKFQTYGDGCNLRKWNKGDVDAFGKGDVQPYQERIAKILAADKTIRVVSLSLGYKKQWIQEDNPQCNVDQVSLEYDVLKETWKNLLVKFSDRLFVVAAGNEGQNFDNESARDGDLWASLDQEPNLLLVGSNKIDGTRLESSNYGAKVLMVKGEEIEALSPLPISGKGYKTNLRGTSFSAPIVAGLVVKIWAKQPTLDLASVKTMASEQAKVVK